MEDKKTKSEKREKKKRIKMKISGKSVFQIRDVILKKAKKGVKNGSN